jgi:uncharacterized protein (TIGR00297 family)
MLHLPQLLLGIILAAGIALAAWRVGALSVSGAFAAWIVGAIVFGLGGWASALPLLVFFGTSTGLSRWRRADKETLGYEKGGRRDAGQVLANGGLAAICVLLPRFGMAHAYLLFLAALAAGNADTWGTEIGSALGGRPYDLRTGRQALPGTSGGVSLGGTLAALAGAALIAFFAHAWPERGLVTAAGLGGAMFDSLLGATMQAQWRDPLHPDRWTERPQPGPPTRGWRAVNNDLVNFLCTLMAACLLEFLYKI